MQKTKKSYKAELKVQDCHWSLYMEEFTREKQKQQNAVANLKALWDQFTFCKIQIFLLELTPLNIYYKPYILRWGKYASGRLVI